MQHPVEFARRVCLGFLLLGLISSARAQAQAQSKEPTRVEKVNQALEKLPHPSSLDEFPAVAHLPCLNQGQSSICWSFATCSFLESEMARLHRPSVRLSVLYPAYCEYLEKTRRFVRMRGASRFDPGDLFTGVLETYQLYGALPADAYDHFPAGGLNQTQLDAELAACMSDLKQHAAWDESNALARVRRILDRYLGEPPKTFNLDGKPFTPHAFADQIVALPWNEYVLVTSFEYAPFNTFAEFKVPDNWHHNTNYINLPLADYYPAFKGAIQKGYSVAVSIDTSEPSYVITGRYCFDLDLTGSDITQAAREERFKKGLTTDDHAIHILGWKDVSGEDWFVAKDSWRSVWRNGNAGTLFLHSSYVKLKILAFIVHRDGVPQLKDFARH